MELELFNHHKKCRFCFSSFRPSQGLSFRITHEVQKKFLKLAQIELHQSRRFSRSICESCSRKLFKFSEFQKKLVKNQERLVDFDRKMNPRVMLQRFDDEPQLPMTAALISTPDPFLPDVKIKLEEATEALVKTEPEDFPNGISFPETWLFSSALNIEKDENGEAEKERHTKAPSAAAKIQKIYKTRVYDRRTYEKQVLRGCKVTSCDFLIHPNLVNEHDEIFHPKKVTGQPKQKVPKASPEQELCPYCGKTFRTKSLYTHLHNHYQKADGKYLYCDLCKYKTYVRSHLRKHMLHVHVLRQVTRYNCSKCSSSFSAKGAVVYHEKHHHTNLPKTYVMETCHICNKFFQSKRSLKNHNECTHERGNFECTKCKKIFVFKPHLENHILSDHSEKVTCHVCGVLSKPGKYFAQHMKAHRSKMCPFEGCNRMIGVKAMKNHIESTHQPLHLQCPSCPSVFKTKSNFNKHFGTLHGRDALVCKVSGCDYKVQRKKYLEEHYMRHKGITEEERAFLIEHLKKTKPLAFNTSELGRQIMKCF